MNLKKLLAVLCACALVFALAIPAFASGAVANPTEEKFEGTIASGTVAVTVQTDTNGTKLYVNPYGLPYTPADVSITVGSASKTLKGETTTSGLFTTPAVIQNNAATALKVSVTMTTTEHGNVKVVASAPSATPSDNTLYGQFEITTATDVSNVITPDWSGAKTVPIPAGSDTADQAGTPTTTPTGFTLAAATVTTGMGGATTTTPSYAAFRLTGTAVMGAASASPGNASSSWDNADVADVVIAFSFEPAS